MEGERRPSKRNSKKENKKHPYKRRFVEDDVIANQNHSPHIALQPAEVANNCEDTEPEENTSKPSALLPSGSDESLTDKIFFACSPSNAKMHFGRHCVNVEDVKEAVQKLKYFFTSSGDYSKECIQEEIDKIFGEKLIK